MAEFKIQLKKGATSNIFQIFIGNSSVTTGAGLTGLTNATGSLVAYYHRDTDVGATVINLVSMTVGTFTSSGFKEIDAVNMPGYYQFCPPDAAFSAGNLGCVLSLQGAANMRQTTMEVQLVGVDLTATALAANVTQIDGVANAAATFNLKKLNIVNNAGDAIVASSTGSNGVGIHATGNGTGAGLNCTGGDTGSGADFAGGATTGHGINSGASNSNFSGINSFGHGSGHGFLSTGGATGTGISAIGGVTSGTGLNCQAIGTGNGISAIGANNGGGLAAIGNGTGSGIAGIGGATAHGINGVGGSVSGSGLFCDAIGGGAGITAVGVGAASILATQGISGPLDVATYNAMADYAMARDWTANALTISSRSTLNALRLLRNKWSISGSTMTVTGEDDTTAKWTATLVTDGTALPVVSFTGN